MPGQGSVVIEFDLGEEPEYDDLVLVNVDTTRSIGDDAVLDPLKGRVRVNGPRGFKITEARVIGDEGLRRYVEEGSGQADYYYVRLGIDFVTHGGPRLESVQVKLVLTAVPETPVPFVLSISPSAEGTPVQVERGLALEPKATLPVVGAAEIGHLDRTIKYERTDLYVRALGLEGSTPGWEFTRATGKLLEGTCRLELIVQAGHDAKLGVSGTATARATHGGLSSLWRYRAELPRPLTFGGDI